MIRGESAFGAGLVCLMPRISNPCGGLPLLKPTPLARWIEPLVQRGAYSLFASLWMTNLAGCDARRTVPDRTGHRTGAESTETADSGIRQGYVESALRYGCPVVALSDSSHPKYRRAPDHSAEPVRAGRETASVSDEVLTRYGMPSP